MLKFTNVIDSKCVNIDYLLELIDFSSVNRGIKKLHDIGTAGASLTANVDAHTKRADNTALGKVLFLPQIMSLTEALAVILHDLGFAGSDRAISHQDLVASYENGSCLLGVKELGGVVNAAYVRLHLGDYYTSDIIKRLCDAVSENIAKHRDPLMSAVRIINAFIVDTNEFTVYTKWERRPANESVNYCIYGVTHFSFPMGHLCFNPDDNSARPTLDPILVYHVVGDHDYDVAHDQIFVDVIKALDYTTNKEPELEDSEVSLSTNKKEGE